jgi:hypothetical protein
MTTTLTVSNSGTAWIKDMMAQGKDPVGGWKKSDPKAAYYESLDVQNPNDISAAANTSPGSFADILKMQGNATKNPTT